MKSKMWVILVMRFNLKKKCDFLTHDMLDNFLILESFFNNENLKISQVCHGFWFLAYSRSSWKNYLTNFKELPTFRKYPIKSKREEKISRSYSVYSRLL